MIDNYDFFAVWLTEKRRLALFPAGIIVRDPHHNQSPTLVTHAEDLLKTQTSLNVISVRQNYI